MELKILLSGFLGTDVKTELAKLRKYVEEGAVLILTIGGETYGEYRWMITKIKESPEHFDRRGRTLTTDVSVSLIEYVKR